uniref:Uncharacterized protein n=1 Tax=Acrobeloides nanus TaxID=290746 RepID=A0A914EAK0_9BILA
MAEFRPTIVREGYENGYGEVYFITLKEWPAHMPELNALDSSVWSVLEAEPVLIFGVMKSTSPYPFFITFAQLLNEILPFLLQKSVKAS